MTSIGHDSDASMAEFLAGYGRINTGETIEWLSATFALIGLTNFGERPVPGSRLAEVLGRPVSEAEAMARQWGPPGTRVEDGIITVNPEREQPSAPRRQLQIGDRRFGLTCCAVDIFYYASLIRPSLQLEEFCPATGTPIQVVFTRGGIESVDPAGAVLPLPHPRQLDRIEGEGMTAEDIDAELCAQAPLYSSAEAAQGWLADHPGGRVFPVREAWDLSFHRAWRDRMSALLSLDR